MIFIRLKPDDLFTQSLDWTILHCSYKFFYRKRSLWLIDSLIHSLRRFYPPPSLSTEFTESIQSSAATQKPLKLLVSQFTTELSELWQPEKGIKGKLKDTPPPLYFFFHGQEIVLHFVHFWSPSVRNGNWAITSRKRERWIDSREGERDVK